MKRQTPLFYRLYYTQLIFNSIVIILYAVEPKNTAYYFLIIFNILGLFIVPRNHNTLWQNSNRVIQIITQASLIPLSFSFIIRMTNGVSDWNNPIMLFLLIVYSFLMYIPYTFVLLTPVKSKVMQIIVAIFSFVYTASSALDLIVESTTISGNDFISTMIDSIFIGAIIFSIMIFIMMYKWGYGFPKSQFNKNANCWVTLSISIFTLWFAMWNAFSGNRNIIQSFFHFNFNNIRITPLNIFGGLEAGIAEELVFRFAVLTIVLNIFYNSRNKFYFATLISSLLFGLLHGMNALAGQSLGNTLIQMIFAFSFGLYLAGIYVYTDMFYLVVIFHALIDTLVFLTTSTQLMSGKVSPVDFLFSLVESAVFIIIGLYLIHQTSIRQTKMKFHLY
ncbi:CPBP family intramembrane glutamic endopeptidase [Companilactobacillus ginsenosidimutans]|uniref:CAAX prenyl protease 2/Lysostaphin resistance protein A-like domain-containing protein n=1 Tax=Companilactobacillus ginsenosidimutans TaxID=1007676 RepID=A0A0H4QGI6_9LACO|nr:CPBP family intramembrane glutamic endopeptidase [Companilactobacillus ginsenosidimutans]AKP67042.1 hypothetical protein ABM34_05465 [Companilactobacillus ginsenosidimutans]